MQYYSRQTLLHTVLSRSDDYILTYWTRHDQVKQSHLAKRAREPSEHARAHTMESRALSVQQLLVEHRDDHWQ